MASVRGKGQPPVGSARWVYDERDIAQQFVDQEVEEFAFSARTELEWLNEHMADIFSQDNFNIAEAFKTPGKLRGKTPRTARKLQQSVNRAPLQDIFTSNRQLSPSPGTKSKSQKPAPLFEVAEDKENAPVQQASPHKQKHPPQTATDSGYHEVTDADSPSRGIPAIPPRSPLRSPQHRIRPSPSPRPAPTNITPNEDAKDSEESFVSADEVPAKKPVAQAETQETELGTQVEDDGNSEHAGEQTTSRIPSHQFSVSAETDVGMQEVADFVERMSPFRSQNLGKPSPASDASSPETPVIRKKSSLNLASLPPRDPLTTKKSFGTGHMPGTARDSTRGFSTIRDSFLNRNKQSQGPELAQQAERNGEAREMLDSDDDESTQPPQPSESTMLHSKTSTQRLHERITMLGKANASRPSKSITASMANAQTDARKTDHAEPLRTLFQQTESKDDDWIAPIVTANDSMEQQTEQNRAKDTTQGVERPQALANPIYPELLTETTGSTTPIGSPSRWNADGPLSASKAKFQSFLRSAKGMFASSAAASAQAKMEAMAPSPSHNKTHVQPQPVSDRMEVEPAPVAKSKDSARKRSASEGPLEGDPEFEMEQPPAKRRSSQRVNERRTRDNEESRPLTADEEPAMQKGSGMEREPHYQDQSKASDNRDIARPAVKKPLKPVDQQPKTLEPKRPKQIARPNTLSKAKPGQISVMVPSMRPQFGASTSAVKPPTQPQTTSQVPSTARPVLTKKASDSSLRSASSQSVRPGPANTKLKALESARRKKEQEEREQQKKEEQKKALEKKKAQKAEEERQAHERKLAEQKREADTRAAAQKRAVEQQKAEKQQREDQLRVQAEATKPKPVNNLFSKSQTERFPAASKTEKVPVRPESRGQDRPLMPHVNPAKPVKRYFNPDADDHQQPAPAPPPMSEPLLGIQKKPKASEEFELRTQQQPLSRPPMGAPVRPSMAKKQDPPAKFHHGFMSANAAQPSMLKNALATSQQAYPKTPHDMATFSHARIPFAEAPNPPGPQPQLPPRTQKTPATAKASPAFPNGDNISLPEIATDSEDDDSDDAFEAPAWTNSPELRQLLEQQQLVDPMRVFGPIAPLSMEEVFKGATKDRMKRFRDRTSSANWAGADRLTEEERKRDREARERLERDGGWTYEGALEYEGGKGGRGGGGGVGY